MNKKPRKLSGILAGSLLLASSLFGGRAIAQEVKPLHLDDLFYDFSSESTLKRGFFLNYDKEKEAESLDVLRSFSYFDPYSEALINQEQNFPELSTEQTSQIENIMKDVKYKKIKSYDEFIKVAQSLPESERLALFAIMNQLLFRGSYDQGIGTSGIGSQNDIFLKMQDFLGTDKDNSVGDCAQIASYTEGALNDGGIRTAAATGKRQAWGHAFDISKLQKGTAIIDEGEIYFADTKNIEKLLAGYQKSLGEFAFAHWLYEGGQPKARIITKDGRNYLDMIDYDETSKPIKDSLVNNTNSDVALALTVNQKDYLTSVGLNCLGITLKEGEIRGDSSSALDKMVVTQAGYNRTLAISNLELTPRIDLIMGQNKGAFGGLVDLIFNSNNKEGINFSSRISGTLLFQGVLANQLFSNFSIGTGLSCIIPTKHGQIEPYSVVQFFLPEELCTGNFKPTFNEEEGGIKFQVSPNKNSEFSFNPYYTLRLWDIGGGAKVNLKTGWLNLKAGCDFSKSTYDFSPDKLRANLGIYASLGGLGLGVEGKLTQTNYDGEKETDSSLSLTGRIIFN
jgi:hypothetical protein